MGEPKIRWRLVRTAEELTDSMVGWHGPLVADVETYRTNPEDGKLLGVALSPTAHADSAYDAVYVVLQAYSFQTSQWTSNVSDSLLEALRRVLGPGKDLVGHNHGYDRRWLNSIVPLGTFWVADTRLMWHLASAPLGPKPYGLKDAQTELLGWPTKGDVALQEQVAARGGKLSKGDHYLADVETLGYYACLDAFSTAQVYNTLADFFDRYDYWWMLARMVRYSQLLDECTRVGIALDVPALEVERVKLEAEKSASEAAFRASCAHEIAEIEADLLDKAMGRLTREANRTALRDTPEKHPRLNLNSDPQKRALFYDKLRLPVVYRTKVGKKASTKADDLFASAATVPGLRERLAPYFRREHCETMLSSFVNGWLESVRNGRIHPGFNPCGTVSYRLSGFKPYLLNPPFDEVALMRCMRLDKGWTGVHADLVSIEPAVTAHFSQDPSLLKVFRDGLGDVYLDLALALFPGDGELQAGYNPNIPVTSEVKERFKKQRKIAKVVQLAVQYTGTEHTVARNLSKEGVPTTLPEARRLVNAYWRRFQAVSAFNARLFALNKKQGYLRNVVGRIIRVPFDDYKDLPNRFVQSSAHDVLTWWVLRIYELAAERGVTIRPVLLDCHDSTSNACPDEQVDALKQVYVDALADVNASIRMSVPVRADTRLFQTLAGLKSDER